MGCILKVIGCSLRWFYKVVKNIVRVGGGGFKFSYIVEFGEWWWFELIFIKICGYCDFLVDSIYMIIVIMWKGELYFILFLILEFLKY